MSRPDSATTADIEAALDYLEADPWCFRSGYFKEQLWRDLKRIKLTAAQISRVEKIAYAYLARRMEREFWYMARALTVFADQEFWTSLAAYAQRVDGTPESRRASYLLAYAKGMHVGERKHQEISSEAKRIRVAEIIKQRGL